MQVVLQRLAPGLYAVALAGGQSVEETPLRVERVRARRDTYWIVTFDGRTVLGVVGQWQWRLAGGDWDVIFGGESEGFDTLRDARLKLEEVLNANRASDADRAPAAEHHGHDSRTGAGTSGDGRG